MPKWLRFWNSQCHQPPLCCDAGVCALSDAKPGTRIRVKQICSGRQLCARMAALGIYPGAELEIVCSGCGCPCLVKVKGGTLTLGAGVSQKILVSGAA